MKGGKIATAIQAKTYDLMYKAVEDGVSYGLHRAYKYSDNPSVEDMGETIRLAVMNSICEWFEFPESP